ncbi:family 43 glycosylhydrolase [Croceiramulus getboli]|nr:family 43 glycosylhydrolase [Flavobacteriaceae bacterium YJPT1-3]
MRIFFLFSLSLLFIACNTDSKRPISDNSPDAGERIIISNEQPRLTEDGSIVDAHDGRVIQFNDTYYWYGTAYGTTNGFTTANYYQVYSSKDLKTWSLEGRLLPDQPEGVYYRPHVIYNASTKKYVLWYNWYPQLWDGQFGVAISDSPAGPFEIVNDNVNMARSEVGLGDFGLFVDDDNTAYISYNTIQNHQVSVEKLNADYTGSTLENGGIIAEHMEAGSQFKRGETYYLLTDYTCCFCNYGSGARVYQSKDPLTGYQLTGNINRYPGKSATVLHDGETTGTAYATLTRNDSVFQSVQVLLDEPKPLAQITLHIFTGNRPANCGDVDNPRVHPEIAIPEFTLESWNISTWEPVAIQNTERVSSALSETLILSIPETDAYRWRITPKKTMDNSAVYINEISLGDTNKFEVYITGNDIPQRPIIPAQQTYVMTLETAEGPNYIWMGDLWGSASDNQKGHDYQYWSAPLEFREDGSIKPMEWTASWDVQF